MNSNKNSNIPKDMKLLGNGKILVTWEDGKQQVCNWPTQTKSL